MKPLRNVLPTLLLVLLFAACQGEATDDTTGAIPGAPPASVAAEAARPELVDGVQVVRIEAGQTGYAPAAIQLQPGVPARLVFTRTVDSECMDQVQIPSFNVPATALPLNEEVAIEFTPQEAGAFTFVCGMDMVSGTIVVKA